MFEPVATSIQESVTKILSSNDCFGLDCISVFEILKIYREIKEEKEKVEHALKERIIKKIKEINPAYECEVNDFDYGKMTLSVSVYRYPKPKETKFIFGMREENFEFFGFDGVEKADLNDIMGVIGDEVNELYQNGVKLKEYETTYVDVQSVNSSFFVSLSATFLSIYSNKRALISDFKVVSFFEEDILYCKANTCDIEETLKDREMEFVKNVFVNIASFPKWLQESLIAIRKEQLNAQKVSEEPDVDIEKQDVEIGSENQIQEETHVKNKKICFLKKILKWSKK